MFRRPRRPISAPIFLSPAMSRALNEVERMVDAGEYLLAAEMLSQLAQAAGDRGKPRWAANLHTRAAHLYTEAGRGEEVVDHARQALAIFLQSQMEDRARQFYQALGRRLQAKAMASTAAAVFREFGARLGALPVRVEMDLGGNPAVNPTPVRLESLLAETTPVLPQHGHLPPECPACGAPVRSDRVDWIDEHSAECAYCGGIIPTD